MTQLLQVSGLTVRFGGLAAVDEVTFDVLEGTIHGLIGPNGAGKTTCFNLISGLTQETSGEIYFAGERIDALASWKRAEKGLARTFQNIRIFPDMSVLEVLMSGMHVRLRAGLVPVLMRSAAFRTDERRARDRAYELLDFVGLKDAAQRRCGDLPYGDQRRLEIGRALASHPRLLLLDEPAAGMNPTETQSLGDLLQRIRATGTTLLLVEHDMHFVMRLCDQITVLNFGRMIAGGTPSDIRSNPNVIEAYLGARVAKSLEAGR